MHPHLKISEPNYSQSMKNKMPHEGNWTDRTTTLLQSYGRNVWVAVEFLYRNNKGCLSRKAHN